MRDKISNKTKMPLRAGRTTKNIFIDREKNIMNIMSCTIDENYTTMQTI